jgi:hypothetical protein
LPTLFIDAIFTNMGRFTLRTLHFDFLHSYLYYATPNSQHLHGRGVDIRPVNPASLARFQAWLDQHWSGALGYGVRRGFVHLDTRNGKGWSNGGEKGLRWNYSYFK